jgi:nicotinate-nucleotide pyrophosphorylase (carboxylating)
MKSYDDQLIHLINEAFIEDIGEGDFSTLSSIPPDKKGKAALKMKQDGMIAGIAVAEKIFKIVDPTSRFSPFLKDGDKLKVGDNAFEIQANIHTILSCERLVLNCMQRMSGIATLTSRYVEKIKNYPTRLLDTRKTTPNFRLLEKEAVRIGGGINHRFGLYDMIMLKDNHIDYCGGIVPAINAAYAYTQKMSNPLKIEVETRNLEDVEKVCSMGQGKVFRIMLDNFTPTLIVEALHIINGKFETEASGGIHLDNIELYAATGVDFVSVGGLIHQAQSVDLSLKAVLL